MIAGLTVADLVRPSERRLACFYDAALVVGGSIVIALCAQIAIGYPVPITGQTFAVLMLAALLGARRGVLCVLTYLAEGLLGLPVFAQGKGGLVAFLGPTGGYLVGFVFAAWIVGALSERDLGSAQSSTTVAAMVLGNVVHLRLRPGMAVVSGPSLGQALGRQASWRSACTHSWSGEALKIALAATLLPSGWKIIRYFGLDRTADIR